MSVREARAASAYLTHTLKCSYARGMKKLRKVPISTRALVQRINRALKPKRQQLKVARGRWAEGTQHGRYYVIDLNRNVLLDRPKLDLEQFARELKVLADFEAWQQDEQQ